jgi:hypothetical protein
MAGPSVNAHYETSTERCGTIVGRCEMFVSECCDRLDLSFAVDRAASGRSPADERYITRRFTIRSALLMVQSAHLSALSVAIVKATKSTPTAYQRRKGNFGQWLHIPYATVPRRQ